MTRHIAYSLCLSQSNRGLKSVTFRRFRGSKIIGGEHALDEQEDETIGLNNPTPSGALHVQRRSDVPAIYWMILTTSLVLMPMPEGFEPWPPRSLVSATCWFCGVKWVDYSGNWSSNCCTHRYDLVQQCVGTLLRASFP